MSVQQEQLAENSILLLRLDSDHTLDFTRTATLHASVIAISVSSMATAVSCALLRRVRGTPRRSGKGGDTATVRRSDRETQGSSQNIATLLSSAACSNGPVP
jgi:hypothetical protein